VVIGHNVVLHGLGVNPGRTALIGMGRDPAQMAPRSENNCLVGAGALVTEGKAFPDNSLIVGAAGRAPIRTLDEEGARKRLRAAGADIYVRRSQHMRRGSSGSDEAKVLGAWN